ncbi:MAG: hypothetical protein GKR89_20785 [Candidatus Latescibacteria bacterium]|nr:hypothetical protein [Candidatus Latescibacterota bacterium]
MHGRQIGRIAGLVLGVVLAGCGNGGVSGGGEETPLPGGPAPLGTQAQLGGQFIEEISLEISGAQANGPGQDIELTFDAKGLDGVKQVLITLELTPQSLFDLENSAFAPVEPFFSLPGMTIQAFGEEVQAAAAILGQEGVSGEHILGTLTLKTASGFSALSRATVRVTALSIGPSSTLRDNFADGDLQMGVAVGPQ